MRSKPAAILFFFFCSFVTFCLASNIGAAANPPSLEQSQGFIKKWADLQSAKDVNGYLALYAPDFKGTKRTASGKITTYNFQQWSQDRRKMYEKAKSLSVVAEDMKVTGSDAAAGITTVEFVQYYTSENTATRAAK